MSKKSLDEIMEGFSLAAQQSRGTLKTGAPVTIWLPAEYKARYDQLQAVSGKRFCKKVRELIEAAIDRCEHG